MDMRIVMISDTHGMEIDNIPPGDILIHAGDWSSRGTYAESSHFIKWLSHHRRKYKDVVLIPGNHDEYVELMPELMKEEFKAIDCHLLIDETIEIQGFKIHGAPYMPPFGGWSFMEDIQYRTRQLELVPEDTNILITHAPPYGILDMLDEHGSEPGAHVGCPVLLQTINKIQPELAVFGHIHNQAGIKQHGKTLCVNAASVDESYRRCNNVTVVELEKK